MSPKTQTELMATFSVKCNYFASKSGEYNYDDDDATLSVSNKLVLGGGGDYKETV